MTEERKNAHPAQSNAAGTNTPLKLTSCMISFDLGKKTRVPQECIGDQSGLDSGGCAARASDGCSPGLLRRKASEAFVSCDHMTLGEPGERPIERLTVQEVWAQLKQGDRGLPDRERGQELRLLFERR